MFTENKEDDDAVFLPIAKNNKKSPEATGGTKFTNEFDKLEFNVNRMHSSFSGEPN